MDSFQSSRSTIAIRERIGMYERSTVIATETLTVRGRASSVRQRGGNRVTSGRARPAIQGARATGSAVRVRRPSPSGNRRAPRGNRQGLTRRGMGSRGGSTPRNMGTRGARSSTASVPRQRTSARGNTTSSTNRRQTSTVQRRGTRGTGSRGSARGRTSVVFAAIASNW